MSIGKNIFKFRKANGLTQEELGLKIGVTNQAVSKWELEISMPDIMILPKIALVLGISLEDLYGIPNQSTALEVSADELPDFCQRMLIELFYYNSKIRSDKVGASHQEQIEYHVNKIKKGFRNGCISNLQGAVILTDKFSFIDSDYKLPYSETFINNFDIELSLLAYLTDKNFCKIFTYQYKNAFLNTKIDDTKFSFEEIMNCCNLTKDETFDSLKKLIDLGVNEVYVENNSKYYVFITSKALYIHSIYKLFTLLLDDAAWFIIRDTTMLSDCFL